MAEIEQITPEPVEALPAIAQTDTTEDEEYSLVESFRNVHILSTLTQIQLKVLTAIATNLTSEEYKTDVEIAADLGLSVRTIYNCRQNDEFALALSGIMKDLIKGKTDKTLTNLSKLAEKDTKANEILLRYSDQYAPTSRVQTQSVQFKINADTTSRGPAALDAILIKLGSLGMSEEQVIERFRALKAEGAF